MKKFTISAICRLKMVCDGCGRYKVVVTIADGQNIWAINKLTREAARYGPELQGWIWRSYGSKGVKHFCPKCARSAEHATWTMEKVLMGKALNNPGGKLAP